MKKQTIQWPKKKKEQREKQRVFNDYLCVFFFSDSVTLNKK